MADGSLRSVVTSASHGSGASSPGAAIAGSRSAHRRQTGEARGGGHHREFVIYGDGADEPVTLRVVPKSDSDRKTIREALCSHFIFSSIGQQQLEGVVDVMTRANVAKDEVRPLQFAFRDTLALGGLARPSGVPLALAARNRGVLFARWGRQAQRCALIGALA